MAKSDINLGGRNLLDALLELAPVAIGVSDLQGNANTGNQHLEALTGYSAEEIQEVGIAAIYADPADRRRTVEALESGGGQAEIEVPFRRKDGQVFQARLQLSTVQLEDSKGLLAVVQDTSEQHRTAEALIESERRHRMIAELMSDFAYSFVVGRNGELQVEWVTDAIDRITGYSSDQLAGIGGWDAVIHPEDADVPHQQRQRLLGGEVAVVEYRIVTGSGETRRVRDHGRPEWDPLEGRVVRIYGAVQDITEKHAMTMRLAYAAKMEAVGSLVGGLVLDFNNLLTGILGQASMLTEESRPGDRVHRGARVIERSANRAAELTEQLMSYAKGSSKRDVAVDLHQVIRDGLALVGRAADPRIRISHDQMTTEASVVGDPSQLQQVVLDLLLNASDAQPDGGLIEVVTRVVEVTRDGEVNRGGIDPGRYVEMEVSDTGVGIPEEIQERIFEPFFTTKPRGEGTGMGLASAYGVVRNHGGSILVESDEGKGTSFRVFLPLAGAMIEAAQRREQPLDVTQASGRVLVVDDEPIILDTVAEMLSTMGYEVNVAPDGVAALEIFSRMYGRLDLVILDLSMPVLDGRDCFMAMREISADVPTLIATGLGSDVDDLLEKGAAGIVRKPFSMSRLGEAVSKAMSKS